tara:strand:+ start:1096 stop:2526 length:1431 start_codon:yes stop_codon:yes gene_type:complete
MNDNNKISDLNLGVKYFQSGKINEAEEIFLNIIKKSPDHKDALHLLGALNIRKGNIHEGIKLIKKSLSLYPDFPVALTNLGYAYMQIKEYDEAIISFKKAIALKEIHQSWNSLGDAYYKTGDITNSKEAFEKSISLNSNNPLAYYNLGIILKKQGNLRESKNNLLKAIKHKENYVDANFHLDSLMSEIVPNWHIEMMNDNIRNEAFSKAIKEVVDEGDFVFEIGTGSGLLSMMAINQGANKVISCESSSDIASIAQEIINKNGYVDKIKIIEKNSLNIDVGNDIPQKADIVIAEILSSEFVGEGVLPSLYDAKRRLLKEDGKMIPESGAIMIALLGESNFIKERFFVNDIFGYDLSNFNSIISRKHGIHSRPGDVNIISDPSESFCFNFYSEEIFTEKSIDINLEVNKNDKCYGIITWNKLNLSKNVVYENNPTMIKSHWMNIVYLFKKPVEVKKGQDIIITGSLIKDRTWFSLKQ